MPAIRVPLRSLEPPEEAEAAFLAKKFPPERVKLFYVLRHLAAPSGQGSIWDRRDSALASVRERQRLSGPPDSLKAIDALIAQLLPDFRDWESIPTAWFDPTRNDTFLNEISRLSSDFRNCHMVPLMLRAAHSGKRVFVVVGGSHAITQEPALRLP